MKWKVTYPLITTNAVRYFASEREARAFAEARRNDESRFSSMFVTDLSCRHVKVEAVKDHT